MKLWNPNLHLKDTEWFKLTVKFEEHWYSNLDAHFNHLKSFKK